MLSTNGECTGHVFSTPIPLEFFLTVKVSLAPPFCLLDVYKRQPLEADKGLGQVSLAGLAENPVVLEEDEYFLLGDNRDRCV